MKINHIQTLTVAFKCIIFNVQNIKTGLGQFPKHDLWYNSFNSIVSGCFPGYYIRIISVSRTETSNEIKKKKN